MSTLACRRCGNPFEAKRVDAMFCLDCRKVRAQERAALYDTHHRDPCPQCGKPMVRRALLCKSCDNKSRVTRYLGENNPNWREGRTMANGYVLRRVKPNGPKPYRLEHRLVWEQAHGPIPKDWLVHHLNGIKDDNRLENLVAMSRSQHHRNHHGPWEERIRELERQLAEYRADILTIARVDLSRGRQIKE